MKRILFLSQVVPFPTDAGPKMRSYYTLRHLSQNHRVTLLAFSRPDDRPDALEHLASFCERVEVVPVRRSRWLDLKALAFSLVRGRPFVIQRDTVSEMSRRLDTLLAGESFDAVHADQLWMAQYALRLLRTHSPGGKHTPVLVLDEHNACFMIFKRLAAGERNPLKRLFMEREWRALAHYEVRACRSFNHVVCVTSEDLAILQPLVNQLPSSTLPGPSFRVIPICIDPQISPLVTRQPGSRNVLHMGTMFFLPNVEGVLWFAQEVWPKVKAQAPEATFTVVGKNPPLDVQALSAQPAIQVTGYVRDPQPYLQQAGVFIVPLHSGGGMRVKIIDAWCRGIPIVSTSIGAEGIRYRDGENILIADNPDTFAQAIIRLFNDAELAQQLRNNGRAWVDAYYNWRTTYQDWDPIYEVAQA